MARISTLFLLCSCLCLVGSGCQPGTADGGATGGSASGGNAGSGGSGSGGKGGQSGSGGSGGAGGQASGGSGGQSSGGSGGQASGGSAGQAGSGSGGISARGGSGGSGGQAGSGGSGGRGGSGGSAGAGSGGRGGSGGTAAGGTTARGGNGGQAGGGGSGGSGSAGGSGGGGTSTGSCTFTQSAKTSTKIATVGIVTWSTSMSGLSSAKIEFGLDTKYGMSAPVDKPAASGNNTTLLLGMKASKTYHYRITATGSDGECTSPDYTIQTGALASGLAKVSVTTKNASELFGGFLITGQYSQGGGSSGAPAYILDKDNEMVWAYSPGRDVTCARMNWAGTHMWTNAANVPSGTATVHRISMDGLTDEDLSSSFQGLNHSLTILPDETVAYYAYNGACDDIKEYNPSTKQSKVIVNSGKVVNASACHVNNIQYSKDDDTLVFSELDTQTIAKVKRSDGSVVWKLNGNSPTITGVSWKGGEHGIHLLGLDRLLFFMNNSRMVAGGIGSAGGSGDGSIAIEAKLDLAAKSGSQVWSYKASGIQNDVMGDLQRLPNGNTIIGYSTQGVVHEVNASGTLLQEINWPLGASFGYIEKRATLYGPPPR